MFRIFWIDYFNYLCLDKSYNKLYLYSIRNKKQIGISGGCQKKLVSAKKSKLIAGGIEEWAVVEKVNEVEFY